MEWVKIARYTQSEVDGKRKGMRKGGQGRDEILEDKLKERNKER